MKLAVYRAGSHYVRDNLPNARILLANALKQVYCWEGVHSACNDREAALEAACLLAEEESAQLVRSSQGKEPAHLLQIYNGKLTILTGPHRNTREFFFKL